MVHRTLDAVMIHKIIARAPERARRVDWARIERNAAEFAARGKLRSEPERPCGWCGPSLPVSGVQQT
jgi:hypothetical protein